VGHQTSLLIEFVAAFIVSLVTTYIIVPRLVPRLKSRGITGKDLNKPNKPQVAEMGGIATIIGFFAGVSVVLALDSVMDQHLVGQPLINVSLTAVLGAGFVGVIDDIFDLRQRYKAILPFMLALPLGAVVSPEIVIPYIAKVDFGGFMIIAAAFAMTCAANAANMLEGFNGLGTGLGIIMALTLIILGVVHDRLDGVYLLTPLVGALIAFLWFNKYPAEVFPGDTMTLFMGAALAAAGLLSMLHVQTVFIFIPLIVEFFLKARGRFRAENYSTNEKDGHLEYQGKIESLTHVFMKYTRCTEVTLVYKIWALEAVFCSVVVVVDLLLN